MRKDIAATSRRAFATRKQLELRKEENSQFVSIATGSLKSEFATLRRIANEFIELRNVLDVEVAKQYGLQKDQWEESIASQPERGPGIEIEGISSLSFEEFAKHEVKARISYTVGVVFGRWDVRCTVTSSSNDGLGNVFNELPNFQPGMLRDSSAGMTELSWSGQRAAIEHRSILVMILTT